MAKPLSWSVRLTLRKDPAATVAAPEPEPTVGQIQETIEAAVQARWPGHEARATATRTDK